ncbi:uncharacterized protein BX663DRAFT_443046 [Cokeromyces recurvatus]|uniref:uncharacterized protein n=1 Tax=Cokeromyces recurvatus TaxID=90255 RepID=UPI002220B028|nr:uncharacterized protein BX663DRAFT_443046 [Cokeromyces recurvatus]KAI7898484.1 hypothetical protein BX663DRAFT_443046 [Cokeromyces recurvatus]
MYKYILISLIDVLDELTTTTRFNDLSLSPTQIELLTDCPTTYNDDNDNYYYHSLPKNNDDDGDDDDDDDTSIILPSATADAMETYVNINENIYCGTATGKSIAEESMPCECKYRPDLDDPIAACGDDNHCINRMMFMECLVDDCPCDRYCRNRRFQLRQYARVDVIRTEKKGFGLRALTDLPANAFIMEYIGEVITNSEFVKRTKEYEAAGLKHYYFMTLKTDEIIDATKKGCLARFINHSCNPNCVTQKWVVGKRMRIGIFTRRAIKAGLELTFDYKFERYGAVAQKCYCGEPNCKGFIGGSLKTNDDIPTNEPNLIVNDNESSSGTDESSDESSIQSDYDNEDEKQRKHSEDMTVTLTQKRLLRKMRRTTGLQQPDEVQSFVKRMLDSVGKPHLVLKLLYRLQITDSKEILKTFLRLHGLKMLKFWLGEWKQNQEILVKVLKVLQTLPLANKNGLEDANMFNVVGKLTTHDDKQVRELSVSLLAIWSQLKSVYRIPKKRTNTSTEEVMEEKQRYNSSREFFDPDDDYFEYLSLDVDAAEILWKCEYPPRPTIPTAPRAMIDACIKNGYFAFGRNGFFPMIEEEELQQYQQQAISPVVKHIRPITSKLKPQSKPQPSQSPQLPQPPQPLPPNWRFAHAEDGTIYYYNRLTNKTQWEFPAIETPTSSATIEGVTNPSDLEELVEKTIAESKKKRKLIIRSETNSPSPSKRSLDEIELKKEVGKIVTKYLTKQKHLWNNDKFLFKELARKITHHIVNRESQSSRKLQSINSVRSKIEKFIDTHGSELVVKVQKKMETTKPTTGKSSSPPPSSEELSPDKPPITNTTPISVNSSPLSPYYEQRSRAYYNRYNSRPPSPYYHRRYYRRSSPYRYYRRRRSLSDDGMYRTI